MQINRSESICEADVNDFIESIGQKRLRQDELSDEGVLTGWVAKRPKLEDGAGNVSSAFTTLHDKRAKTEQEKKMDCENLKKLLDASIAGKDH